MQKRQNVIAMTVSTSDLLRTLEECDSLQVCIFQFEKLDTGIYL